MTANEFLNIWKNETVFAHLNSGKVSLNFSDGVRFLYPGASILPGNSMFLNIYICDEKNWESVQAQVCENTSALFVVLGCATGSDYSALSDARYNTLMLSASQELFFERLSNLQTSTSLKESEDALYNDFWDTVIANKSNFKSEITEKLAHLPYALKTYTSVIVVRYAYDMNQSDRYVPKDSQDSGDFIHVRKKVLADIRQFFSGMNVFYYQASREFIVLHTQSDHDHWNASYPQSDFDYSAFSDLLTHYHLHAGISNSGRALEHLSTSYRLTEATLNLAERMKLSPKYPNIYQCMEFQHFHLIELAKDNFVDVYGHDNIVYLAHPAVIQLMRHDKRNGTDLFNVLYAYLAHKHSVTETAKSLYVHRNTVQNKLSKIRELTGLKLDDVALLDMLLMSCDIVMYYRNYIGEIE